MKSLVILLFFAFSGVLKAQIPNNKTILTPMKLPTNTKYLITSLRVDVSVFTRKITVKEHWQHTDLFNFQVFEISDAKPSALDPHLCSGYLKEIKDFQVSATNLVGGDAYRKTYSFTITGGLKANKRYGVNLISNEYLVSRGRLLFYNITNTSYCNSIPATPNGDILTLSVDATDY